MAEDYYSGNEKVELINGTFILPERFCNVYLTRNNLSEICFYGFFMQNSNFSSLRFYDPQSSTYFDCLPDFCEKSRGFFDVKNRKISLNDRLMKEISIKNESEAFLVGFNQDFFELWNIQKYREFDDFNKNNLSQVNWELNLINYEI